MGMNENLFNLISEGDPSFEAHLEKMTRSMIECILKDSDLLKIYQEFGYEPFRRSSALYGLDRFLKDLNPKKEICLEIGTFHGITAVILSRYFDKVISLDIMPSIQKRQIIKKLGIDNVQFIDIKNNREKEEVIKGLKFQFCFMDGDHRNDTMIDWDLVKSCGKVLFHEYWISQPSVFDLFNSLEGRKEYGGINFAYWEGL